LRLQGGFIVLAISHGPIANPNPFRSMPEIDWS